MTERSEGMPGARAPASRTAMGPGGAAPEKEMSDGPSPPFSSPDPALGVAVLGGPRRGGDDVVDPYDVRRSIAGAGALRALADATVLGAADVRTALTLGRLAGGADDEVLVAAALAVRAVRLGHVYVDLATAATTAVPDDDVIDLDLATLPWPDPAGWPALVSANPLTSTGVDGPADRPLRLIGSRLYLDRYWRHERTIVADLLRRSTATGPPVDTDVLAAGLRRLYPDAGDDEGSDDRQRLAAATAVLRRFTVVAGGPGTGKTTTVARILALLHEQAVAVGGPPPRVGLAAPTGKAAARLAEAVHAEAVRLPVDDTVRGGLLATPASTLHRLLGWQPGNRSRFRHDAANQLPHNVVIVDESSMVSLSMMAKLLAAVRASARLVLVGDPRQLASVEAGAVLGDIVGPAAGALQLRPAARGALAAAVGGPVEADDPGPDVGIGDGIIVLRRVHRFGGGIAAVADAVEAGDPDAVVAALRRSPGDVRWLEADAPVDPSGSPLLADVRRAVVDAAVAVVTAARRGDAAAALEALRSVQVLCAHRRGPSGAGTWRAEIERWLRAAVAGFGVGAPAGQHDFGVGAWYAGRPLLVTENDY
ncbi:MAG: exodeoxyribonuclease V subunit alpha, partial [Acidimicrobiales bacterium]